MNKAHSLPRCRLSRRIHTTDFKSTCIFVYPVHVKDPLPIQIHDSCSREGFDANKDLFSITIPAVPLESRPHPLHCVAHVHQFSSITPTATSQNRSTNSRSFTFRTFRLTPLNALVCIHRVESFQAGCLYECPGDKR